MPQAGVTARARRRDAAPWWEELDREAFRFPTAYEVKPAQRPVARTTDGAARTAPDAPPPAAAANRRHSARVAGPSSPPRPVAAAPAPRAAAPTRGSSPALAPSHTAGGAPSGTAGGAPSGAAVGAPSGAAGGVARVDGARRTVTIRGRGAERNLPVTRPTLRRHERPGFRPDRAALWAFFLGLVLILVAVASAHG